MEKTEDTITLVDVCAKNSKDRDKYYHDFVRVFRTSLAPYWSNLFRFDVTGFDEKFIKSGDENMGKVVLERYGQEGVDIIKALL